MFYTPPSQKFSFFLYDGSKVYLTSRPGYFVKDLVPPSFAENFLAECKKLQVTRLFVLMTREDIYDFYDDELLNIYKKEIPTVYFPIKDFSVPGNMSKFHEFIEILDKSTKRGNVLIHCNAGLGRTGLVAACLMVYGGLDGPTAIKITRKARTGAIETPGQEKFIMQYQKYIEDKI